MSLSTLATTLTGGNLSPQTTAMLQRIDQDIPMTALSHLVMPRTSTSVSTAINTAQLGVALARGDTKGIIQNVVEIAVEQALSPEAQERRRQQQEEEARRKAEEEKAKAQKAADEERRLKFEADIARFNRKDDEIVARIEGRIDKDPVFRPEDHLARTDFGRRASPEFVYAPPPAAQEPPLTQKLEALQTQPTVDGPTLEALKASKPQMSVIQRDLVERLEQRTETAATASNDNPAKAKPWFV